MAKKGLDRVDRKILNIMKENARIPNSDIAKQLGMAPSGILERVRKLEKRGIIRGYKTIVNEKEVGMGLLAFVFLRVNVANWSDSTAIALQETQGVQEVHEVAGEYAYLLKVRAKNTQHLSELLKYIGHIENVTYSHSTIVLDTVLETPTFPIDPAMT